MIDDLRHATRSLLRAWPASLAVATAMMLGIGATTAVVSIVRVVLLAPLPFSEAERIVALETFDQQDVERLYGRSNPWDVADWRASSRTLSAISAWQTGNVTIQSEVGPVRVGSVRAAPDMDRVLGLAAAHGRFFESADFARGARAVVLGDRVWRNHFAGDPDIIGRSIEVSTVPHTVVGVLPPSRIDYPADDDALWLPMTLPEAGAAGVQRAGVWLQSIGRLAPGATLELARAEMTSLVSGLRERYPDTNADRGIAVVPLREHVSGPARPVLLLIAGAVALVLLVACASVGMVLLARAHDRRRELAVRAALGADARSLARHLFAESGVLAVAGAVPGILLAPVAIRAFQALYPGGLPRGQEVTVDLRVLGVALAATATAALAASLPAVLQIRRSDVQTTLRGGERGLGTRGERRFRSSLVVFQVAISAALLFAGAQLGRTFIALSRTDPGFAIERVVSFSLAPRQAGSGADEARFHEIVLERIRALPGVTAAGTSSLLPLASGEFLDGFRREGYADELPDIPIARLHLITPGFLEALDLPVVAGRGLTPADRTGALPVAFVNDALQRRFFPEGATGRRIQVRGEWREIAGVLGDKRHAGLREAPQPDLYLPLAQAADSWGTAWYVVRGAGGQAPQRVDIQRAMAAIDPTVAVADFATMRTRLNASLAPDRFRAWLVGALSILALVLAIVGLWGLLAWTISRETRDIGIRAALGRAPRAARRAVIGRALRLCALGLALGLGASLLAGRALAGFLAGVSPRDPASTAAVCLALLACAAAAAAGPAWRASRVDPMHALRGD